MGKSALLRQFLWIAEREGLPRERMIVVDLDYQHYPTPDSLAQALAGAIRQNYPGFDQSYQQARARREQLAARYYDLERQWLRWEALRRTGTDYVETLLDAHSRVLAQTQIQRAKFGLNEPVALINQAEQALDEIAALRAFRDEHGQAPQSFDELLRREFGPEAALFDRDGGLGQALADDLYVLAETEPLILAIDTYELADRHDDWLRTSIIANGSDRMLTIIAGRNRLDDAYRRTFSGEHADLVRSYNLSEHTLRADEIREYLKLRLKLSADPPANLVAEAYRISRGIPVALEALGDQLAGLGQLTR
jgi:hypothetical protein